MPARRGADQDGQPATRRTHMLFGAKKEHTSRRKARRPTNKLHQHHDKIVQTGAGPTDIDPSQWTGNQRVLHYGPMANRDPFFYYYPKGWDILYPAQFGFFPYRTTKFRGSSPTVCLSAFGVFFLLGGLAMMYLGYIYMDKPFWERDKIDWLHIPALQVSGPVFCVLGVLFLLIGVCWWFCGLHLFTERLRHSQPHRQPPKRTIRTLHFEDELPRENLSPYEPPAPPAYPVLINAHTEPYWYSQEAEMKLYPPVQSGYSTLSLQRSSYIGSPYNTLGGARSSLARESVPDLERRISKESRDTPRGDYHHAMSVPAPNNSGSSSGKRRSLSTGKS